MKVVRLIKLGLSVTYYKAQIGYYLSDTCPIKMICNKECSIATAFQLYFRICHSEASYKPGRVGVERDTLASGLS